MPGCVHTDLLTAGLIPDPFLDDNEYTLGWVGRCDWEYTTTFTWTPDGRERHDLVFDGLDTAATVMLNGRECGQAANQHRSYRIPVGASLRSGENELVVVVTSPVRYADRQAMDLGYRPHAYHHPFNAIRKSACNFGWDWGPDLATAGIWRPVRLHGWSKARLAQVRPQATIDGSMGRLAVHVCLERPDIAPEAPVTVTASVDGRTASVRVSGGDDSAVVRLELPGVRRWWPRGYGDQPLYPVKVHASVGDEVVDTWQGRVGFRKVRLDTTPDEYGTPMRFVVNDQPIFVRGVNWIPDDVFVHRVSRQRYAERIAQAEWANANLIRVWGGGIYEDDAFYDLCDERGMLTWQDFLFACAAYAEEEPLWSEVEAEARDAIVRLAHHPSLVVWNGSNENYMGYHLWGWPARLDGKTWGLNYYTSLLPGLVAELDPDRPYTPSSPWSGAPEADPQDPDHGSVHVWNAWNAAPYAVYRDTVPRFVAEFGWQGPPAWATLRRAISDEPLMPESPGMQVHQKAWQGNEKLIDGLLPHFPLPESMEDWHWAMSLNQANAMRFGIEHYRSHSPRCAGTVVWQLNDCWPVTSWSAVDGDGRPKPLLYALAQAYADRLLTVQPRGDGLGAVFVNDTGQEWTGQAVLRRLTYDGIERASGTVEVTVPPREVATIRIPDDVAAAADERSDVLVVDFGHSRALWFYAEYRESNLAAAELTTDVVAHGTNYTVWVTAANLVRDVAILADKVHPDARVDDMLVTLLPGESVKFGIRAPAGLEPAAFAHPSVLRTANDVLPMRPPAAP